MQSDCPARMMFTPVLYVMVNFDLKLIVGTKAGYLEDPLCISVVHDPLLDRDSLIQPASDFEERLWRRFNGVSPAPPRIARSSRAEELMSIPTRTKIAGDRLTIIVGGERKPTFDGRLIEHVSSKLLGRVNSLLRAVFDAALLLPEWDRYAKSVGLSDRAMIALCVTDELANDLGQSASKHSAEASGLVLLGERKFQATSA